jgi:hypothetical protein
MTVLIRSSGILLWGQFLYTPWSINIETKFCFYILPIIKCSTWAFKAEKKVISVFQTTGLCRGELQWGFGTMTHMSLHVWVSPFHFNSKIYVTIVQNILHESFYLAYTVLSKTLNISYIYCLSTCASGLNSTRNLNIEIKFTVPCISLNSNFVQY